MFLKLFSLRINLILTYSTRTFLFTFFEPRLVTNSWLSCLDLLGRCDYSMHHLTQPNIFTSIIQLATAYLYYNCLYARLSTLPGL